jgi:hypothetical protein
MLIASCPDKKALKKSKNESNDCSPGLIKIVEH